MTFQFTLISLAALGNLCLGAVVLWQNPRGTVQKRFALFSFAVAVWTLTSSFVVTYHESPWSGLLGRTAFASASLIPLAFLLFAVAFPRPSPKPARILLTCFKFAGVAALLLSFTTLIVKENVSVNGTLRVVYGPLHLPFGLYFVTCLGFSLFLLTRKFAVLKGFERLQVRYVFLGVLTAGIGATFTSLFIPLLFRTSQFSRYGPLFGLWMIAMIAHSIIRHRLMDIKVVIKQSVVYVCAIIAAASVFLLAVEILARLTRYERHTIHVSNAVLIALALAIFFQPLKSVIQRSFNHYLYRETYDYHRTVREASRRLSAILELEPLLNYLTGVVERTFKVETVTVYLKEQSANVFVPRTPSAEPQWPQQVSSSAIPQTSPLVAFFTTNRTTVVREEAARDVEDPRMGEVALYIQQLGGDLALPLIDDSTVVGIMIVGPKRSGDPYFAQDLDLLDTLISQAAVAMKNAQLYRQVVLVNEYVDNILSTMDSGVVAVNSRGQISLFNPAAERLTGFHAPNVHGQPYQCLPDPLASPLRDTLDGQTPRSQFEISIKQPDETTVPLVCSTAILKHREGPTHGALIVFSDVTRLKDLEREKRRAERLASFGTLASGVAHEIKNPLVAIRTFAELLPERFADTDFREDFAKVVIREISRIDDLVDRLRGIAATAPQQVGTTDIREPLKDTLTLLRAQLEHTRTTVYCDFEDPAPFVAVAEVQLKQLFLNVLLNSIEAMGPGGQISIHVSRRELRGSPWISVEIFDTGPGIPDSVRSTIFDPFFTTKARGSGLGLAICRGITDAHRGTIRAGNRTDRAGATIIIEFPLTIATPLLEEEHALRT